MRSELLAILSLATVGCSGSFQLDLDGGVSTVNCLDPAYDLDVTQLGWNPSAVTVGAAVVFHATVQNPSCDPSPGGLVYSVVFSVDGQAVTSSADQTAPLEQGGSLMLFAASSAVNDGSWTATSGTHAVLASLTGAGQGLSGESDASNDSTPGTLVVPGP